MLHFGFMLSNLLLLLRIIIIVITTMHLFSHKNECLVWLSGIFQPHIQYLLCLATPMDIVLLGVSFTRPYDGKLFRKCMLLVCERSLSMWCVHVFVCPWSSLRNSGWMNCIILQFSLTRLLSRVIKQVFATVKWYNFCLQIIQRQIVLSPFC